MAKRLQLIDFKSQGDDEPLEFDCSDGNATILDVKKVIDELEGLKLKDLTKIKIYWEFTPLHDDVFVKELLDQDLTELNFCLPQYNVSITSNEETFIFSEKKIMFGFGVKKKCLPLHAGCTEGFKIPKHGKFAVMRNKIEPKGEGQEQSYFVRYYEVQDDWEIEINVDRENMHNVKVSRVLKNGDEKKLVDLVVKETKEFSMKGGQIRENGKLLANVGPYINAVCTIVSTVIRSLT